ncbi:DUF4287 domain-containing protein [candidate division KSB1 bacterium]|nr:DUF4287 domain-containing protein [candidate division KSB1 bacterium]
MASATKATSRMSDAAVQAKTGKTWNEWFKILDKAGGKKMNHKEIVAYLSVNYNVGPWWQQMVTVTYEQARGLREAFQKAKGYSANSSKTIAAPLAKLYKAWSDAKLRNRWLAEKGIVIRTATPEKSMRITWSDGKTSVSVYFLAKGEAKSQVALEHEKLPDAKAVAKMKAYWVDALGRLQEMLE